MSGTWSAILWVQARGRLIRSIRSRGACSPFMWGVCCGFGFEKIDLDGNGLLNFAESVMLSSGVFA